MGLYQECLKDVRDYLNLNWEIEDLLVILKHHYSTDWIVKAYEELKE